MEMEEQSEEGTRWKWIGNCVECDGDGIMVDDDGQTDRQAGSAR